MNFSEKTYRFLLRAYPRDYREQYAEPTEQLFRDRLREARTFSALAKLWRHTLSDWAATVPARYWEQVTLHWRFRVLTDPAQRCLFFARWEASSFSRREITVEHLLLGIMRQERSLIPRAAQETVMRAIEANEPAGRCIPPAECLALSEQTIRVVAAAREIADTQRRGITPLDLVAGIQRAENTLGARLLREHMSARS
jgi:hypothetical protein